MDQQPGTICHAPESGTNLQNERRSHDADVKNGLKQIPDAFNVTGENSFFRGIAAEELIGRHQPVLAPRKLLENLSQQGFAIIIQNVPGTIMFRILQPRKPENAPPNPPANAPSHSLLEKPCSFPPPFPPRTPLPDAGNSNPSNNPLH